MEETTQVTATETKQDNSQKTFTQDEVNSIIQKRLAEEKSKSKNQNSSISDEKEKELQERESKLVISERKFNAKQSLSESNLPAELIDFLDYSSDDSYNESISKLLEIFSKYGLNDIGCIRVNTALDHGNTTSNNDDVFTKILRE